MADRLVEMEVRTLSDTLAVLDANALVDILTTRHAEVEIYTLSNIFFKVKADALGEILSAYSKKVDIEKITKRLA